jgi:hypothetical protein
VFRGESGRITADETGADRSAPEVDGALYLRFGEIGGLMTCFCRGLEMIVPGRLQGKTDVFGRYNQVQGLESRLFDLI